MKYLYLDKVSGNWGSATDVVIIPQNHLTDDEWADLESGSDDLVTKIANKVTKDQMHIDPNDTETGSLNFYRGLAVGFVEGYHQSANTFEEFIKENESD